jgi:hypothetical protein
MMWISVEDPPKTRDTVLLCEDRYEYGQRLVSAWYGTHTHNSSEQPEWRYVAGHDLAALDGTPLYWMPTPELPRYKMTRSLGGLFVQEEEISTTSQYVECGKLLGGSRKPHE